MSQNKITSPFAQLKQELKKVREQEHQAIKQKTTEVSSKTSNFAYTQPEYHQQANNKLLSDEDNHQLFLQAMQGVTVLPQQPAIIQVTSNRKVPDPTLLAKRLAAEGQEAVISEHISDQQALLKPVASEEVLNYKISTLPNRIFEQLKQGKLRWYQAVDLHGCTVEQAREAVLAIIDHAEAEQQSVVKIVHGKGQNALLKTCVNGWLRQHSKVLAFHSTPEVQGGTGSVLVLLKKQKVDEKHVSNRRAK